MHSKLFLLPILAFIANALICVAAQSDPIQELKCSEVAEPAGNNDGSLSIAMGFLQGFIQGANAANPDLLGSKKWDGFAGDLFILCAENGDRPFVEAVHDIFYQRL